MNVTACSISAVNILSKDRYTRRAARQGRVGGHHHHHHHQPSPCHHNPAATRLDPHAHTRTHANLRSVLILLSVSRRMRTGSLSPARANCTSCLGMVAEKSSDCLSSGTLRMISRSCSAKPISNSRSASSKTITSTLRRVNSGTSWRDKIVERRRDRESMRESMREKGREREKERKREGGGGGRISVKIHPALQLRLYLTIRGGAYLLQLDRKPINQSINQALDRPGSAHFSLLISASVFRACVRGKVFMFMLKCQTVQLSRQVSR